jgi:hypothetical protein
MRKALIFVLEDLEHDLPSQFGHIERIETESDRERHRSLSFNLMHSVRAFLLGDGPYEKPVKRLQAMRELPPVVYPMLWTSSYGGRKAWTQFDNDPLCSEHLEMLSYSFDDATLDAILDFRFPSSDFECLRDSSGVESPPPVGRISVLREYGGKNRCFAIPSSWCQLSLFSLHSVLFKFLESLPSDFTHNQNRFRVLLQTGYYGSNPYSHCYDLSSATDCFPIEIQVEALNFLFLQLKPKGGRPDLQDISFGQVWEDSIKRGPWSYKKGDGSIHVAKYTGQPMGAFSSWAVFSVCHHLIV